MELYGCQRDLAQEPTPKPCWDIAWSMVLGLGVPLHHFPVAKHVEEGTDEEHSILLERSSLLLCRSQVDRCGDGKLNLRNERGDGDGGVFL